MTDGMSSARALRGLPEQVHGFALIHLAMRRDARRLVTAAPTLPPARFDRVLGWWNQVRDVIVWHHRTEDDVLWPELRRRVPGFEANEKVMNHDHVALDQAIETVAAALRSNDQDALVSAANWFDALIREHLQLEEALVFPVFRENLSVEEYASIERRVLAQIPMRVMAFLLPWMLDEVDTKTAARVTATMPPPVRLLGTTVLTWHYRNTWRWW